MADSFKIDYLSISQKHEQDPFKKDLLGILLKDEFRAAASEADMIAPPAKDVTTLQELAQPLAPQIAAPAAKNEEVQTDTKPEEKALEAQPVAESPVAEVVSEAPQTPMPEESKAESTDSKAQVVS